MKRIIKFYKDEKLLVSSPLKGGSTHKERIAFANLLGLNDDWTHCVLDGINDSDRYGHYRSTHEDASPYWTTFDKDGVQIKPPPEPPSTTRVEVLDEVISILEEGHQNYCSSGDGFFIELEAIGFANAIKLVQIFRNKQGG